MKISVLKFFLLIFGIFSLFPFVIYAQVQSTDVTLSISPKYPTAGQKVTARISSYVTDLNKANMFWSINGETIESGVGKKVFSFTLGGLGSTNLLSVDINTIDRQNFSKSITLNASEIDMLWEATDSYVPPFYKGKALVSREGTYKVVAIPNISSGAGILNPANLSFTWEKDGNGQPNSSGWGKTSFVYKNSYLDLENEILVKVSDIFGSINTGSKISLRPTTPQIKFYKGDFLLGIDLGNSLNSGHLLDKEGEVIVAVPYFFTPKDINSPDLVFNWEINGKPASSLGGKNELKVKGGAGISGNAKLWVDINNTKTLFQSLKNELSVIF